VTHFATFCNFVNQLEWNWCTVSWWPVWATKCMRIFHSPYLCSYFTWEYINARKLLCFAVTNVRSGEKCFFCVDRSKNSSGRPLNWVLHMYMIVS